MRGLRVAGAPPLPQLFMFAGMEQLTVCADSVLPVRLPSPVSPRWVGEAAGAGLRAGLVRTLRIVTSAIRFGGATENGP